AGERHGKVARHDAALLIERRRIKPRIESSGTPLAQYLGRAAGKPSVERVVAAIRPFRWGEVIPASRLGDESAFDFTATFGKSGDVTGGRERAIVQERVMNAVGQKHAIIRMSLRKKHGKQAAGPIPITSPRRAAHAAIAGGAIPGPAEPAVRIVQIEFKTAA